MALPSQRAFGRISQAQRLRLASKEREKRPSHRNIDPLIEDARRQADYRLRLVHYERTRNWFGVIKRVRQLLASSRMADREEGRRLLGDYAFIHTYERIKKYLRVNRLNASFDDIFSNALGRTARAINTAVDSANITASMNAQIDLSLNEFKSKKGMETLNQKVVNSALARNSKADLRVRVEQLLRNAPERTADVVRRRYGIGTHEQTLAEIGRELGMTRQGIRQIMEPFFAKLREKERIERLVMERPHQTIRLPSKISKVKIRKRRSRQPQKVKGKIRVIRKSLKLQFMRRAKEKLLNVLQGQKGNNITAMEMLDVVLREIPELDNHRAYFGFLRPLIKQFIKEGRLGVLYDKRFSNVEYIVLK